MAKEFHFDPDYKSRIYPFLQHVGHFVMRVAFKTQIIGLENLPKENGFILASNHTHAFDPAWIVSFCPRVMHFMAKKELFQKSLGRWFCTVMYGFPINREGMDAKAMHYAETLLKKGDILGIFPEGTRSKTKIPGRAKAGVAMIARATHADVVPVSIYYTGKLRFRTQLTIRFGEVIPYEALGMTDDAHDTQQLRDAAKLIMERIVALWEKKHQA